MGRKCAKAKIVCLMHSNFIVQLKSLKSSKTTDEVEIYQLNNGWVEPKFNLVPNYFWNFGRYENQWKLPKWKIGIQLSKTAEFSFYYCHTK
jgi:hypothetical protein